MWFHQPKMSIIPTILLNGYCGFPQPCPPDTNRIAHATRGHLVALGGGVLVSVEISVSQTMQNVLLYVCQ